LCRRASWSPQLAVVGRGFELEAWRARAEACGLANRILFLGFRSDVPRLLKASDVLVAPSRYEAYGLGVHEAICSGVPALVTREAGVAERYPLSLDTLLLDEPNDVAALAQKLEACLLHDEYYRGEVLKLSIFWRTHTWDAMAAEIRSHMLATD